MFTKARLTLTAWYVCIIFLVSVSFSIVIYRALTGELDRVERMHRIRHDMPFIIDHELIEEAKDRVKMSLIIINAAIVSASSLAGYFLAGRTLKPIQDMIDEQYRFITDASHQLRTPITSLKAEIEINLRDKKLHNETRTILASNLEDVNNLQRLSDNLISLASFEGNGSPDQQTHVSLKNILKDARRKVLSLAAAKTITIRQTGSDATIRGDREKLVEAFVIFLDNAIKYSPKGTNITTNTTHSDRSATVEIIDEGLGIDTHDIPHIFERFYRSKNTQGNDDMKGFGLGLSIAKQILDAHHAAVRVTSDVGKGTTFSIRFPF